MFEKILRAKLNLLLGIFKGSLQIAVSCSSPVSINLDQSLKELPYRFTLQSRSKGYVPGSLIRTPLVDNPAEMVRESLKKGLLNLTTRNM